MVRLNRTLRLLCTLCIGVWRKCHLHFTFVLAKIIRDGAKFIQMLTLGFKYHMRNLKNFRQAVVSSKNWNLMGFFVQTAKIYTEDLSNITFNYLHKNSPNYVYHFWNHKSFFRTQLFSIFLAQTLHNFYKSSPSKWKFSDLPLQRLKLIKFPMSFFK